MGPGLLLVGLHRRFPGLIYPAPDSSLESASRACASDKRPPAPLLGGLPGGGAGRGRRLGEGPSGAGVPPGFEAEPLVSAPGLGRPQRPRILEEMRGGKLCLKGAKPSALGLGPAPAGSALGSGWGGRADEALGFPRLQAAVERVGAGGAARGGLGQPAQHGAGAGARAPTRSV